MAHVPKSVAENDLSNALLQAGLVRINQGKVRDTYEVPHHTDLLLVVATDRASIFDFVLLQAFPGKGELLTALTVFWLTEILKDIPHHLVAYGAHVYNFLPSSVRARDELGKRALIVKRLEMIPIECIVRGYLTGTGYHAYKETGVVCGYQIQSGLYDGSKLPQPLFTPTTKADVGHDEHVDAEVVNEKYGTQIGKLSLAAYNRCARYAAERNLIIADTKFEFGWSEGKLILGDEIVTMDSSRVWDQVAWVQAQAQKQAPIGFDKQFVREWGITLQNPFGLSEGLKRLKPENQEHLAWVDRLEVPGTIIKRTLAQYKVGFYRLTGKTIAEFQDANDMNGYSVDG